MALRKEERLADVTLVVDGSEVEAGVETVTTAGGEDEPVAVAAPVVPGVGVTTVGSGQRMGLARLEIQQPVVGFLMPDREAAVVAHREHDVFAVVGRTGVCGTLAEEAGVENRVDLAVEGAVVRMKGYLADIVSDVLVMRRDRLSRGGTEIERAAVGREHGISLVVALCHDERVEEELVQFCVWQLTQAPGAARLSKIALSSKLLRLRW